MSEGVTHHFQIAEYLVDITFSGQGNDSIRLAPSLEPFRIAAPQAQEQRLFHLSVEDELKVYPESECERIRVFDTGNGDTIVDRLEDGGYQFVIKDIQKKGCCLLITNKDFNHCQCMLNGNYNMRSFGLNNALMLVFAFAAAQFDTLLIHASLVRQDGYGYAFIAKSGTGKSTQVSMWLRHIPGCDLMNDDNPIVRIINGEAYIYGSPWSGKTPCYRNVKAKLGAITRIDRAEANSVSKLNPIEAFVSLLSSCSSMKWDHDIYQHICDTVTKIVETADIYTLHCLPNKEAAEVCHRAIHK